MPSIPEESGTEPPQFIFTGTVQKLKAATVRHLPVTDQTAIVRINEVIQAPAALRHWAGQDITVTTQGRKRLAKGQQATFYAHGVVFGESIAVHADEYRPISKVGRSAAARASADPAQNLAEHRTAQRFDAADLVVSGKVTKIHLPELRKPAGVRGAAATLPPPTRISEHDPLWQDAEVEIDAIHKGEHPARTVTLRFPASTDVMWHTAPKFTPGQEGVFMLHKDEPKALARALAGAATEAPFTALHPADFHPSDSFDAVHRIMDARRPR